MRAFCPLTFAVLLTSCILWHASHGFTPTTDSNIPELKTKKMSPEEIVRLEMEEFEREMEEFKNKQPETNIDEETHLYGGGRKKRTVIFNTATPVALAMLFGVPFTVILPTLTNFFNWKWKRSVAEEMEELDDIGQLQEEDPIAQPHLDRISTYFELIKIPEKSCQQRAICEFSADPEKYYPVSELVLNRIRNPSLPLMAFLEGSPGLFGNHQSNNTRTGQTLFQLYSQAADKGLVYGNPVCVKEFGRKCPHSIEKRLNMPVLQFWNLLSSLLKFSIRDDMNFVS